MPLILLREMQAQPSPVSDQQCRPIAPSIKLCVADMGAIFAAVFFIWYIVWGIPMTIRFYKSIRARRAERQHKMVLESEDIERNFNCQSADGGTSSSANLCKLLNLHEASTPSEAPYQPPLDEKIKNALDRRRLNNFKFPPTSHPSSAPPLPSIPSLGTSLSIPDFYSVTSTTESRDRDDATTCSNMSLSSCLALPPGLGNCRAIDDEGNVPTSPPPTYLETPPGMLGPVCKPCMW